MCRLEAKRLKQAQSLHLLLEVLQIIEALQCLSVILNLFFQRIGSLFLEGFITIPRRFLSGRLSLAGCKNSQRNHGKDGQE